MDCYEVTYPEEMIEDSLEKYEPQKDVDSFEGKLRSIGSIFKLLKLMK
jgi:hypothetical protein